MIKILTILLFININCFAQSDSIVWKTNNEVGVISYNVEQSVNQTTWTTLGTIVPFKKDSNEYAYALPAVNYYYRIKANMVANIYVTDPQLLSNPLPVELSNISVQNKILTFTSNNENNLDSYIIYESTDGVNFIETLQVLPKGNSVYKIQLK